MDAAGLASVISPEWFAVVNDVSRPDHASVAAWTAEDASVSLLDDDAAAIAGDNLYDWIVQFDAAALTGIDSVAQTASLLVGGGVEFQVLRGLGLAGMVLVRSSEASLDAVQECLRNNVNIASFEQEAYRQVDITSNDPKSNYQWDMTIIDAQAAWGVSTGSSSVVVAINDTGVDYNHVDLAANIWTNPGEIAGNGIDDDHNGFIDDIHGYDFVNNDGNPMDDANHGTHVAGTIAAVGNNGIGIAGVNWSASIMALKFLDNEGVGYLSDALAAINYATMMRSTYGVNVRVSNNSWGGGPYSSALLAAIQANNNAGILFVAAAGNESTNNDVIPQYPANYASPNVISVAATTSSDQLASFSCYGATTVDIAAPGESIYSTITGNRYAWFSGTSMATPHVAGVAALAWAVAPNASVAEVRNAILQGADPLASLSGKVATGGRLNAYNTLQLLNQTPNGPAITALIASPNSVALGSTVTLSAAGVSSASGTVAAVYFYRDANSNSVLDAGDALIGSDTTIQNGSASIAVDTTGLAGGSHRFFARAVDSLSQWSNTATTLLSVVPPDDHGGSAARATALSLSVAMPGAIGVAGDTDWFSFQTVAGKTYTLTTQLGTLYDSVLYLIDRNGSTVLAANDDYGSSFASRIVWTAPASGAYYVAVVGYGNYYTGSYSVMASAPNSAPVLAPIANCTMSYGETSKSIQLNASDPDGDALVYLSQPYAVDPIAQKAYELDQVLGLYRFGGGFYTNGRGLGEKYLGGRGGTTYIIMPTGALYRWGGSFANSPLVGILNPAYYTNPALLYNAQPPGLAAVSPSNVSTTVSDGVLTITRAASYTQEFYVCVAASDGKAMGIRLFKVTVTNVAPTFDPVPNQTMSADQQTLAVDLSVNDPDGDALQYSARIYTRDVVAAKAYALDRQLGLWPLGNYYTNLRGLNEKYLVGTGNQPYYILPSGALYRWGGSIANSTLVDTLSPAYHANPALLHNAVAAPFMLVTDNSVTTSFSDNVLTINRAAGYLNNFFVQVCVTDGRHLVYQSFYVANNASAASQSIATFKTSETWTPPPSWAAAQSAFAPSIATQSVVGSLARLPAVGPLAAAYDDLFSRSANDNQPYAGINGRLDDLWTGRFSSMSSQRTSTATDDEDDETAAVEFLACGPVHRDALDAVFDLLGSLD